MSLKDHTVDDPKVWKLCRFRVGREPRVGLITEDEKLLDLSSVGVTSHGELLEDDQCTKRLEQITSKPVPALNLSEASICAPVEQQEVWAAGVTYLRSKTARMEESDFSATAYDRVYEADRPELFFKSQAEK